jgi:hypothetical protein
MLVTRRPLAVGVFGAAPDLTSRERAEGRVQLALFANDAGYAILETYDVGGNPRRSELAYLAVEELARRFDVEALCVAGHVDARRLEDVAADVRMVIVRCSR